MQAADCADLDGDGEVGVGDLLQVTLVNIIAASLIFYPPASWHKSRD
jgi:hypothetical protein